MSDEKALALLLADKADKVGAHPIAAELRRLYWDEHRVREHRDMLAAEVTKLHEEIQSLRDRLAKQRPTLWALKDNPGITTHSRPQMEQLWDALGPMV
jgi:hypothetical protein